MELAGAACIVQSGPAHQNGRTFLQLLVFGIHAPGLENPDGFRNAKESPVHQHIEEVESWPQETGASDIERPDRRSLSDSYISFQSDSDQRVNNQDKRASAAPSICKFQANF